MGTVERANGDGFILQLFRFVDAEFRIGDDGESGHCGAQGHDLGRTVPGRHVGFDGAFHHSPLAHAKLIAGALIVERFHGAVKNVVSESLVISAPLRRARGLENLDVQPLILEETLIARHEQGQVVDSIHHRSSHFLQRLGGSAHRQFLSRLSGSDSERLRKSARKHYRSSLRFSCANRKDARQRRRVNSLDL